MKDENKFEAHRDIQTYWDSKGMPFYVSGEPEYRVNGELVDKKTFYELYYLDYPEKRDAE